MEMFLSKLLYFGILWDFKCHWNSAQFSSLDLHVLLETLFSCKLIMENNRGL